MQVYEPYHIHHADPDQHKTLSVPISNSFVVLWSGNIPLAHLWIEKNNLPESETAYRKKIEDAIQPAKTYYRHHPLLTKQNTSGQKLSVIICTRNREKSLEKCIHALLNNSDTDFELIVIDNAPENSRTKELVQKLKHIKYIPELRKGMNMARNTGARSASHALVAYTGDEVIVGKDWIRNIKNAFTEPQVMAIAGIVFPASLDTSAQYTFEKYAGFNEGYLPKTIDQRFFNTAPEGSSSVKIMGASTNMAFRREVFDWVGGFDERLSTSGCNGDTEIWYRILANGWTCLYIPSIYVFHSHPETRALFYRQLRCYLRDQTCSFLVQQEKFLRTGESKRRYTLIPANYYHRVWNHFIKKEEDQGNLYSEMKGLVSGWFYYYFRKNKPGYEMPFFLPYVLHKRVSVNPDELVSVIIPCYNDSAHLEETIESVLNQTHQPVEVIVVDDGAEEDIGSICRRFREKVQYTRIKRSGVSIARNRGVHCSHGSFLIFLNADDYLYPDAIAQQLDWFLKYPDAVFISGGHDKMTPGGSLLPEEKGEEKKSGHYESLLKENYISVEAAVMYRRSVFPAFHFDPVLDGFEDYDLNLRIARHFEVYTHTGKIAAYRIHRTNTSVDRKRSLRSALTVMYRQKVFLLTDSELLAWKEGIKRLKRLFLHSSNWPGAGMNRP